MADSYLLVTGLDYTAPDGEQVRAEADEVRDDLPEESLPWLLDQGLVVPFEDNPQSAPEPPTASTSATKPLSPVERLFAAESPAEPAEETK